MTRRCNGMDLESRSDRNIDRKDLNSKNRASFSSYVYFPHIEESFFLRKSLRPILNFQRRILNRNVKEPIFLFSYSLFFK